MWLSNAAPSLLVLADDHGAHHAVGDPENTVQLSGDGGGGGEGHQHIVALHQVVDGIGQPALVSYLESFEGVRKVNQSFLTAQALTGVNAIIGYVSIGIIVILFLVSIFLISNTVSIGISVRKEEIQIMKYIGATDFFTRAPFVIEGMLIGLIGSFLPLIGVYFIYNEAMMYVAKRFPSLSQLLAFLPVETVFTNLIPVCIGLGVGIGFIGSFTTVRKHLSV